MVFAFDLDGTLTDPGEGITNSVAYALKKWGIEVNDKRELYSFIGPPLSASFKKYFGFSEDDALKSVEYYREYFRERGIFENEVYGGVPNLLATLKEAGKTLILATSKPEGFAKQILDHFDLAKYFTAVAGATMDEKRTNKAEVIRYALEKLGVKERSHILMVGDREHDILGAKAVGLMSLGVLYGYGDRAELTAAGADLLAETPMDVCRIILGKS